MTRRKLKELKIRCNFHILDTSNYTLKHPRAGEENASSQPNGSDREMSSSLFKLQKILKPLMTANCSSTHTCQRGWQRLTPKYSVRGCELKVKLATDTRC